MINNIRNIIMVLAISISSSLQAKTTYTESNINVPSSKEDKIFTREYTYNSSEDDSKNSSRKKAIQQIKILLTQEIGTHIESYLEIQKKNINGTSYKSIKNEIRSLSAGITKVKVLKEKWNGKTYYIKASVKINEKRTMELLLQSLKDKSSEKDVKRLNKILAEQKNELNQQNSKVQAINKKLISQEIVNEARKNEVLNMKKKLVKFNKEEIAQKKEAKKYKTELERKKALIKKLNSKSKNKVGKQKQEWLNTKELLCSFDLGSSYSDIKQIIGVDQFTSIGAGIDCYNYPEDYCVNSNLTGKKGYYLYFRKYSKEKFYNKELFAHQICPSSFLTTQGYKCIYLNIQNNMMVSKEGCK